MPQLEQFDTYLSQIFWLLVTFGILYVVMSQFLIPRMVSILEARVFQIESDQRRAEEARMEADEFGGRIAYMVSMAQIDGDRQRADVVLQERGKTDKRLADLEKEIESRIATSEARLLSEHERSLSQAESSIAEVVDQVLERILGARARPAPGELRELVREAISALPHSTGQGIPQVTPQGTSAAATEVEGYAQGAAVGGAADSYAELAATASATITVEPNASKDDASKKDEASKDN